MERATFEAIVEYAVEKPGYFTARNPLHWFRRSDRYVYRLAWGAWVAGFITCPLRGVFAKEAGVQYLRLSKRPEG